MLRITAKEKPGNRVCLVLEGRLIGPWTDELETAVMSTRSMGMNLHLDLSGLRFADVRGLSVLHRLIGEGVLLEGASPFIHELLTAPPE